MIESCDKLSRALSVVTILRMRDIFFGFAKLISHISPRELVVLHSRDEFSFHFFHTGIERNVECIHVNVLL